MAESRIQAVISDFGGVLTTPLIDSFLAFQRDTGVSPEDLGKAMARLADQDGRHPLFEMERGRLAEAQFLSILEDALEEDLGRRVPLHGFRAAYFDTLQPNEPMIGVMRELGSRDYRMALLTNNVREWEPHWRSMLPVDEIFEHVVDSAFVGMRKPEPEIYRLTLDRLGCKAAECLFIDDVDANCEAAAQLGLRVVLFRDNEQAIAEIEHILAIELVGKRA